MFEMTHIGKLPVHEAANIVPIGSDYALEVLIRDISENGQLQSIILHKGAIIDGRRRALACRKLGIEPETTEVDENMSEDKVYSLVLSLNNRRNLLPSQQAMVSAVQVKNKKHLLSGYTSGALYAKEKWGVGQTSYDRAMKVLKYDHVTAKLIFETGYGKEINGKNETLTAAWKRITAKLKAKKLLEETDDYTIDYSSYESVYKKLLHQYKGSPIEEVLSNFANYIVKHHIDSGMKY